MSEAPQDLAGSENQHNQSGRAARRRSRIEQFFATVAMGSRLAYRRAPSSSTIFFLVKAGVIGLVLTLLVFTATMLWALFDAPLNGQGGITGPSLLVEAANGAPLGRVGPMGDGLTRKDFPDLLVNAVVSIEDRRFFSHRGVDLRGIARAAYANWIAGGIVEGGSTITQQLAKMQVVGAERSMSRKVREACTAIWLELRLGKDEILTRYLNTVYLGAGAHGMSAAARTYFDKSPNELTLPEAAMLAGLIQAPSKYNPIRHLDVARARAAAVIEAMLETGAIDAAAAAKAKAEPAVLKLSPRTAQAGSWFADWIAKSEVPKLAGASKRALRVRTTLQPQLQQLAEQTVEDVMAHPDGGRGADQAALVALRPDGSVVAMVGGRDYEESEFNRAVDAKRQPGSAFKLFVYYAALKNGYSPETRIDASPIEVGEWEPENYGGEEYGRMTLSQAFAKSVNSAAVRLAENVGLDEVVAAARELGLNAPLAKVPSMALGTNEVTLLDLTGAYASVRAGHPKLEPWGIAALGTEGSGLRSLSPPPVSRQPLAHDQDMISMLRDVVDHGTGRAAALNEGMAAGKTGTSQDYRDAWFVGFSDALVVGVWVGNDDHTPMDRVTGGSLPAQIWKRFVSAATPLIDHMDTPAAAESPPAATDRVPVAAEIAAPAKPQPASRPECDQSVCAAEYSSFRASDCTYQPFDGPRRLCEKSVIPSTSPSSAEAPPASTGARCDRNRCAQHYRSFDDATCTYQPYDGGPRQICDIGAESD